MTFGVSRSEAARRAPTELFVAGAADDDG